jgi:hypothetical protein
MPQPPKKKPPTPDDDPENPGGDDDDAPVTKRDLTDMVNGAVNNLFKRKLGPAIQGAMAPVLEQLKGLKPRAEPDEEPDDADDAPDDPEDQPAPPKGKQKPARPDPALARLLRQHEDLKRQMKERDDKLAAAENARKAATIDKELTEGLTKLGVDPLRMRGALAVHKSSAFVDDADGRVRFKIKRDGYDEDLDPADALKEWGETDEGKSYIAASGSTGGAGARAPKAANGARKPAPGTPEAKAQAKADARTQLMQGVAELLSDGSSIAIE